jgi:hypothetical protein
MTWRVYKMAQPASSFAAMPTLAQTREIVLQDSGQFAQEVFDQECKDAMEVAKESGWDGEFLVEPHVFTLPNREDMQFGIVWTQPDEERTTFVVSPLPLPWLESPRT